MNCFVSYILICRRQSTVLSTIILCPITNIKKIFSKDLDKFGNKGLSDKITCNIVKTFYQSFVIYIFWIRFLFMDFVAPSLVCVERFRDRRYFLSPKYISSNGSRVFYILFTYISPYERLKSKVQINEIRPGASNRCLMMQ